MERQKKHIGIAMSGGVDSTACALLLSRHHRVHGFFMELAQPDLNDQRDRVQSIANQLGIPLSFINLQQQFRDRVLEYFTTSYYQGQTPNPCVICNRQIKFGLFLQAILTQGMDYMATGHYAIIRNTDGVFRLFRGRDPHKDQSYFLSRLGQDQLQKVLFPLGEMTKDETYRLVQEHGFTDFAGRESQDVCFLGSDSVADYLENLHRQGHDKGPILSTEGRLLGVHEGIHRYTIGQRRGLGISSTRPLYVVRLDRPRNAVIVGDNEELWQATVHLVDLHWLGGSPPDNDHFQVRIRYSHRGADARLELTTNKCGIVHFHEPQRAITPGQFAVFYQHQEVIGSGIIVAADSI